MSTEDRDQREGMDAQADEALWTLLGRRELPRQVSPYFARRVLREIGLAEEARATGWLASLRQRLPLAWPRQRTVLWSGVLSGLGAVGLACLVQMPPMHPRVSQAKPSRAESVVVASAPQVSLGTPNAEGDNTATDADFVPVGENEVIADLDNILQREESRLWTDDTSTTARF